MSVRAELLQCGEGAVEAPLAAVEAFLVVEDAQAVKVGQEPDLGLSGGSDAARRWFARKIEGQFADLAAAGSMVEGETDALGRGWEKICADVAYQVQRAALALEVDAGDLLDAFLEAAPRGGYMTDDWLRRKWAAQGRLAVEAGPWPLPDDFGRVERPADVEAAIFGDLAASLAEGGSLEVPARPGGVLRVDSQAVTHAWGVESVGAGLLGFLFRYADGIVRVTERGIRPVNATTLAGLIQNAFEVEGKEGAKVLFPKRNAELLMDVDSLPNLRELRGVIETPVVRPDGSVLCQPGFDEATGLYFLPGETVFPEVSARPSRGEVVRAREWLDLMLCDFAFVSPGDKANYVGALLTPLLRLVVGPPYKLVSIEARQPGSGKTFLGRALLRLHGGRELAGMPASEEEFSKTIASILRETSGGAVMFDNVSGVVRSTTLTALLTQPVFSARLLGSSSLVSMPNDRLWVQTGNNVMIGGDVARRAVRVMIDPGVPNPELRTGFRIPNWEEWVQENRPALIWALLTLVTGALSSGGRLVRRGGDSYGAWVGLLDLVLGFAGYGQFDAPSTRVEILDEDEGELADFVREARRVFGDDVWQVKDVRARLSFVGAVGEESGFSVDVVPDYIVSGVGGGLNVRRLGHWVRQRVGRWCSEGRIVKVGVTDGAARYVVEGVSVGGGGSVSEA